jgi:hypothetical protein
VILIWGITATGSEQRKAEEQGGKKDFHQEELWKCSGARQRV